MSMDLTAETLIHTLASHWHTALLQIPADRSAEDLELCPQLVHSLTRQVLFRETINLCLCQPDKLPLSTRTVLNSGFDCTGFQTFPYLDKHR